MSTSTIKLPEAVATLLLPDGVTIFFGTVSELIEEVTNAYWVWDDAPVPYPVKRKKMKILADLAAKHGHTISI